MPLSFKSITWLFLASCTDALATFKPVPCPDLHIFGARETGRRQGYGTSGAMVNMIQSIFPATSEAIIYPACAGELECGNFTYAESVQQGTQAVATAVTKFAQMCPFANIIMVGYSQGAQIMENALCGGGDPGEGIINPQPPLAFEAVPNIVAVILMGDPRWEVSAYYNVGTCRAGGFDARPPGFQCLHGAKIQSYCDEQDIFCCNGTSLEHHGRYVDYYGEEVMAFVEYQLAHAWEDPDRQNIP